MEPVEAIHARRSVREYQARSVDRRLVEDILWDAAQAPTALNVDEPFVFIVIEGADRITEYGALALRYARAHRGSGSADDWVDRPGFSVFFNAPIVVVICGPDDGHGQAIQDCNRAGQNLMLAAHARGLGTCWVGSPMQWLRDPATRASLGVPERYAPFAAITLGYPSGVPAGTSRARPKIVWRS